MAGRASLEVRPLGAVHPAEGCAFCGQDGSRGTLDLRVIRSTMAYGWLCRDAGPCVQRQEQQRQLRLFGEPLA
jgi:hypothetical protein